MKLMKNKKAQRTNFNFNVLARSFPSILAVVGAFIFLFDKTAGIVIILISALVYGATKFERR